MMNARRFAESCWDEKSVSVSVLGDGRGVSPRINLSLNLYSINGLRNEV